MNAPESIDKLIDVQKMDDDRAMPIDAVGIRSIRHPVQVRCADGSSQACVAMFDMFVSLPAKSRGTHMSRFVETLEANHEVLSLESLESIFSKMLHRLQARAGLITISFPYFIRKRAPVSGIESLLDYDVCFTVQQNELGKRRTRLQVIVPVTSLCPCSKAMSAYGAHNQRSHITVSADVTDTRLTIDSLVAHAEQEASCEVYGLLKRSDEKFVTERAYENAKFAEDLVRDIAKRLDGDARVGNFCVEAENFESIHNHSAYARIDRRKTKRRTSTEDYSRHRGFSTET